MAGWLRGRFGRARCRETVRAALRRQGLTWKKARKLLGRADPERRRAFLDEGRDLLAGTQRDRHLLVYLDEAHVHHDADLGRGWAERGRRLWVASRSPRLSERTTLYGLYLYNEGEVRLWPYDRADGANTVDALRRLRAEWPGRELVLVWDGAPWHRAVAVREAAEALGIRLVRLPAYSPDLMPVEALWRWLREDVTYHHCHPSAEDLDRRVEAFETRLNRDPCAVADRLWVKDALDHEEEILRFSS